jgi:hypothetical protein
MAGHFQNLHPNVTARSPTGKSGSKFVTVIVTGDQDHQIHTDGYQVRRLFINNNDDILLDIRLEYFSTKIKLI